MNRELRKQILVYNRTVRDHSRKSDDLDALIVGLLTLPPGQLNKILTDDVLVILRKYGLEI